MVIVVEATCCSLQSAKSYKESRRLHCLGRCSPPISASESNSSVPAARPPPRCVYVTRRRRRHVTINLGNRNCNRTRRARAHSVTEYKDSHRRGLAGPVDSMGVACGTDKPLWGTEQRRIWDSRNSCEVLGRADTGKDEGMRPPLASVALKNQPQTPPSSTHNFWIWPYVWRFANRIPFFSAFEV